MLTSKEVGQEFKRLRIERSLTQKDMSEKTGIYQTTVARLESGKIPVTSEYLAIFAAALKVTPGEIIMKCE